MARTIYTQDAEKYIPALAEALKKIPEFEVPEWSKFVKTGISKSRPPVQEDFWYIRAASILRQLYIKGVVGVGKLRTKYGSKKDRGGRPDGFRKASGKVIRVILQQAEAAGLVEKLERLQYGRRLTQKGKDLLDSIEVEAKKNIDLTNVVIKTVPKSEDLEEQVEEESNVEQLEGDSNEESSEDDKVEIKEENEEEENDK